MYIVHYSVFSLPTVRSSAGSAEKDIERVNNYDGESKFNVGSFRFAHFLHECASVSMNFHQTSDFT